MIFIARHGGAPYVINAAHETRRQTTLTTCRAPRCRRISPFDIGISDVIPHFRTQCQAFSNGSGSNHSQAQVVVLTSLMMRLRKMVNGH